MHKIEKKNGFWDKIDALFVVKSLVIRAIDIDDNVCINIRFVL